MFFYASSKHLFYGEGCIKLASGLSGTVSFLQVLGSLYNSFGIKAKSIHVSSRCRRQSIVGDNITKTVSEVKQRFSVRETTAINGPEGTVSNKTQVLLEGRMRRLRSIASIDNGFLEDIDLHISHKSCGESKRSQVFYS